MKSPSLEKIVSVMLIAACLCVFGGVARNGFVNFDDGWYVTQNPHVRSGLTFESTAWAFKTMSATNWHPLTWLSHMLDYQLFGLNPTGHHLNNLFLHIANALLLFLLLRNTTGRLWESAAVAALFALHPLRVESVAWISERKDVLSGFFGMLTMLAYVHYVRRQSIARYALTLLLFALGLMAKPMLVTLPFVLLLLDFWPLHRFKIPEIRDRASESTFFFLAEGSSQRIGTLVIEKVPFLLLSAASSVVTYIAQSTGGAVSSFELIPLKTRIANALVSYWQYLEKTFWPQNLAVFYPHPGSNLPLWEVICAGLFLIAVSVLVLFQARRRPFLLTGWLWFLGMLVPVLGILQVGGQAMADRYTYLPSIGIFIMIAWIPQSLPWRVFHREFLLASGFTVILLSLSSITWLQTGYWKDTETVFHRAAAVTENNYLAHCLMGDALASQNQLTMAVNEYEKALAIFPRYAEAHHQLGMVLAKQGCLKEAVAHYEEALRAKPKYALAHVSIAGVMAEQGNLDEAMSHYLEALYLEPDSGAVYNGLGVVMATMQRLDESIYYLFKAVELCQDCPEGHANLGRVLTLQGNLQAAFEQLFKAIELQPSSAETHNNLALAYLQLGALDEALYHVASALHLRNDYGKARANLRHILSRIGTGEPIESSP